MVLPTFVRQALLNDPITVFGTGQQTRCFSHVEEIVEALLTLVNRPESIGEIINLGNNQPISIMELAKLVKEIAESDSEIVTIPYSQAYHTGFEDMAHRIPDISQAQRLINFRPQKSMTAIITDILAWMKTEKKGVANRS
jgi:UDP-glucose 4-epimerase